ncbi:MAG: hypothetical protein ABSH10_06655 [Phycisphaerae bacterium]|jgi:hypothetical protein
MKTSWIVGLIASLLIGWNVASAAPRQNAVAGHTHAAISASSKKVSKHRHHRHHRHHKKQTASAKI